MIADIREKAAWVAAQADFVHIRRDLIPAYTSGLLARYPLVTALDDNHLNSATYILALDSINFGSGYFHIARQADVALEYDIISGGLKKYFEQGKMDAPEKWVAASAKDFYDMLSVPKGTHTSLDRLMGLFAAHLNETGKRILADHEGDVSELLMAAGGSAVRLAGIVASWPTFRDISSYKGADIPIFKRAQILAADMHLAGHGDFTDMDQLTIFADNMVPHVLRCDGILEYAPTLAARIDGGEEIASGSAEETELRACAIHAVELMKQAAGGKVTSVNLDHILWKCGYEPGIYARPSHRTMTVWY